MHTLPKIIIIAGPTASGKSSYAEQLARERNGEIVNADAVQMYTKLAVGTAKPDWRSSDIPHHLFDICDKPVDFDVVQYHQRIREVVSDITNRGKVPILVGGSLFYIKSLFYPPVGNKSIPSSRELEESSLSNDELWAELDAIDSERAAQIHPNDRYRVGRALMIYKHTGKKPSSFKPIYKPFFEAELLFLSPPLETLYGRINTRTLVMINEMGWIDEARECYADGHWRDFVAMKGFIGYPELFAWIAAGEPHDQLPVVIDTILKETRHYAKRQRTFWRSFCEQVASNATDELPCVIREFAKKS